MSKTGKNSGKFLIPTPETIKYVKIIKDYYVFIVGLDENSSIEKAKIALENIINGLDFDGNQISFTSDYFDDRLEFLTKGYYVATQSTKGRYKYGNSTGIKKYVGRKSQDAVSDNNDQISVEKLLVNEDYDEIDKIKKNLLLAYPSLSRNDLDNSITNYCKLSVLIKKLVDGNVIAFNVALKNLIDTYIKLGNYLGIDEGEKSKVKDQEDRQSVAALSIRFQQSLTDMPDLIRRMRYKEIRILLSKYDRQEISKELFAHYSYAGMSVEEARELIRQMEPLYDPIE
jgi:hypothetical protein